MNFTAVILAGGHSRRMGRDKRELIYRGRTLLELQIETARKAGATEVLVSVGDDIPSRLPVCKTIQDRFKDCGPLAGIEAGLAACATPLLLVMAVDMPQLAPEVVGWLLAQCSEQVGAVAVEDEAIHSLCGIYPKVSHAIAEHLLRSGNLRAQSFVHACALAGLVRTLPVPLALAGATANWNYPEQVEA